jgi:ABC-type lipoprotein export system ATPase subunit
MGPSGTGKTTLLDLILGLLQPSTGEILVDGKNISENKKGWQSMIGHIPQDIYLLDDTVKNNIAIGVNENEIDYAKMEKSIKQSQLNNFINKLPKKIETVVYNKPYELSGGEKQRVAIARALINDPSIILADEPSGNLDSSASNNLHELFNELRKDFKHTFIIATHDISLAKKSDRILKISDGKIK